MTVSSLRRSDASMPMTANGSTTMPVSTAHGSHWAASRMGAELNMRTAIPTETITKIDRSTTRAMIRGNFGRKGSRVITCQGHHTAYHNTPLSGYWGLSARADAQVVIAVEKTVGHAGDVVGHAPPHAKLLDAAAKARRHFVGVEAIPVE